MRRRSPPRRALRQAAAGGRGILGPGAGEKQARPAFGRDRMGMAADPGQDGGQPAGQEIHATEGGDRCRRRRDPDRPGLPPPRPQRPGTLIGAGRSGRGLGRGQARGMRARLGVTPRCSSRRAPAPEPRCLGPRLGGEIVRAAVADDAGQGSHDGPGTARVEAGDGLAGQKRTRHPDEGTGDDDALLPAPGCRKTPRRAGGRWCRVQPVRTPRSRAPGIPAAGRHGVPEPATSESPGGVGCPHLQPPDQGDLLDDHRTACPPGVGRRPLRAGTSTPPHGLPVVAPLKRFGMRKCWTCRTMSRRRGPASDPGARSA